MPTGHGISGKDLQKFLARVPWDKVAKKAEHAPEGTRVWPTNKSKDAENNFRLDAGRKLGDRKAEVVLQANLNAAAQSVKKAAQQDSHQIIAKAITDAQNDANGESAREQIEEDFESRK
jgi:hypothetical protein